MPKKQKGFYALRKVWGRIVPLANYALMWVRPVKEVYIHHTVTAMPLGYRLAVRKAKAGNKEANKKARRMEKEHMRLLENIALNRGFEGISYSEVVFPSGRVYVGRGFQRIGAHTYGRNSYSYGIVFVGNFQEDKPTTDALRGARFTINKGKKWHRIDPKATVQGHRDAEGAATACPGQYLYARLDDLR